MSELSTNQLDALNRLTKAIAELIGEHLPSKPLSADIETILSSNEFYDAVAEVISDDPSDRIEYRVESLFDDRIGEVELSCDQIYFDSDFYETVFDRMESKIHNLVSDVLEHKLTTLTIVVGE